MQYDESVFQECLKQIEAKLGWGEGNGWSKADFDMLSEKIFLETGVNLSTSTLKRIWGKVKYESVPQVATLNALARFAGHENYRDLEIACRKNRQLMDADTAFAQAETFSNSKTPQINTPKKR